MTKEERKRKIEQADQLIRLKATGSATKFAEKLGMSKRNLHRLLDFMRELGAPIAYCKTHCRYYYEYEVEFIFGFRRHQIDPRTISGGCGTFSDVFSRVTDFGTRRSHLCTINVENRNWGFVGGC